jgi:curved DNA-binding protein
MEYKDYYKTLGVDRQVDDKEIKKAYRKLARETHPDRNPGNPKAEERFKEINEAYEVLGDAEKRRTYDELGSNYFRYQQMGGDPRAYDFSQWARQGGAGQRVQFEDLNDLFGGGGDFSDFFSSIFGSAGGARTQPLRRNTEQPVQITLEEAYAGTARTLVDTSGDRFTVKIPAGIDTGQKVRFRGKGSQGGDLFLVIEVLPNALYERDGADLRSTVTIDVVTAVLGGSARVPTFKGDVSLKIPAGTQGGRTIRLAGRGMPQLRRRNEFGDLLVQVQIRVPTKLDERERELYEQLAALKTAEPTT